MISFLSRTRSISHFNRKGRFSVQSRRMAQRANPRKTNDHCREELRSSAVDCFVSLGYESGLWQSGRSGNCRKEDVRCKSLLSRILLMKLVFKVINEADPELKGTRRLLTKQNQPTLSEVGLRYVHSELRLFVSLRLSVKPKMRNRAMSRS